MKAINEYLSNKIADAEAVVTEHLLKARTDASTQTMLPKFTIDLPIIKSTDDSLIFNGQTRTIECEGPFVVYSDPYSGKRPHIATVGDMIFTIAATTFEAFETFSASNILGSFETLKSACCFIMLNYLGYTQELIDKYMNGEYELEYMDCPSSTNKICDSWSFICDCMNGEITDDELINGDSYFDEFFDSKKETHISHTSIIEYISEYFGDVTYAKDAK